MAKEVVLLHFWVSPMGMRARIALNEKGVDYEYREEDVLNNKSEFLLMMNPVHKKIPVLVHNDNPICESMNIVHYIDEVWSHTNPLLPSDLYERAQARFWADYIDKKIYETGDRVWKTKGVDQEAATKELIEHFKLLEQQLGDKPYFGGDAFGIVDIILIPFYSWFYVYETSGNFKFKESCPKIIDWANRCMQRKSVIEALPDQQQVHEFILKAKKRRGIE